MKNEIMSYKNSKIFIFLRYSLLICIVLGSFINMANCHNDEDTLKVNAYNLLKPEQVVSRDVNRITNKDAEEYKNSG